MDRFPVGFWNYSDLNAMSPAQVDEWDEMGMTLTMSPNFNPANHEVKSLRAILDRAHGLNMKIIVRDSRTFWPNLTKNGRDAYIEGFRAALRDFGDHPAVWGFCVGDEPNTQEFEDACAAASIQREIAPQFEPFINLLPWHTGIEDRIGRMDFAKYLDEFAEKSGVSVLCYDCYSQMNEGESGFNMYFNNLRHYAQAAQRNGIPFWTTLLSIGHFRYRTPSIDDFRWQIGSAAAHGAKGLLWFYIYQHNFGHDNYRNAPINEHGRKTQPYYDLADTQVNFNNMYGQTLLNLTLTKVQHVHKTYGGFPLFEGDAVCKSCDGQGVPLILSYFTDGAGKNYVMMTNNSCTQSAHGEVGLRGEDKKVFFVSYGKEREVAAQPYSNTLSREKGATKVGHWLCPGQQILIRYE